MAVDAFALILAMLGLGLVFARLRVLPDNSADVLNRIVLYICLPASVLTYVPRLHLDASLGGVIATPWLLTALIVPVIAVGWAVTDKTRWSNLVLAVVGPTIAVMLHRMQVIWFGQW